MTKVNYAAMSDRQLKQYILSHRDDQEAFYAYIDRRHSRPNKLTIQFEDPAWEEKIVSAIQTQLNAEH